jgi:ABC-type transport system involved in multi-copper enzyme maturation permease subunit
VISALRYEWVRIRTVRSTWVLSVLALVLNGAIAFALAETLSGEVVTVEDYRTVLTGGLAFTALFMALVGVFGYGHEYRHGTIRVTLTAVPQRGRVFLAKAVVLTLRSVLVASLALAVAWASKWAALGDRSPVPLSAEPLPRVLAGSVLLLVVPLILDPSCRDCSPPSSWSRSRDAGRYLPFTAAQAVNAVGEFEVAGGDRIVPWEGAVTFGGFAAVILALTWLAFTRRDA